MQPESMLLRPAIYLTGCKLISKPKPQGKASGFTIVELLITITIAGILAATAIPSFRSYLAWQSIKNNSFDMISSFNLARSEAIMRNANVTITPIAGVWTNGWAVTTVGGTTLSQQDSLSGVTITCISAGAVTTCPATLTYAGNGRLTVAIPSFLLSSTATSIVSCINIGLSGRPNSKATAC